MLFTPGSESETQQGVVTTRDELFQASLFPSMPGSSAAGEVARYRDALKLGHEHMCRMQGIISNNTLIEMFRLLENQTGGFRAGPGTVLMSEAIGETTYIPSQDRREIVGRVAALEQFFNDDAVCTFDPLIKMALIHHQFESIYPFRMETAGSGVS